MKAVISDPKGYNVTKEAIKQTMIRVPFPIWEQIKVLAQAQRRSVNQQVIYLLVQALENEGEP